MKRPSPEDEGDILSSKRQRMTGMKHHAIKYRQPGARLLLRAPQDETIIEEELTKAICTTLHYVGFDGATKNALEGFRGVLQEYIQHFVWRVKQSMQQCRRSRPIPHDFVHALSTFSLSPSSLKADLQILIPPLSTLQPLFPSQGSNIESIFTAPDLAVVYEPSGLDDSVRSRHIPKHFPKLPSSHTYRETPIYSSREGDPRKIRELATEEGMLAEQALRKLMAASKAGRAQMLRSRAQQDERWKREDEMFREAMEDLGEEHQESRKARKVHSGEDSLADEVPAHPVDQVEEQEDEREREQGMAVNYERSYWRHGRRGLAL